MTKLIKVVILTMTFTFSVAILANASSTNNTLSKITYTITNVNLPSAFYTAKTYNLAIDTYNVKSLTCNGQPTCPTQILPGQSITFSYELNKDSFAGMLLHFYNVYPDPTGRFKYCGDAYNIRPTSDGNSDLWGPDNLHSLVDTKASCQKDPNEVRKSIM